MGPLALMAKDAGMTVFGSDLEGSLVDVELEARGIEFQIGAQDGRFLQQKVDEGGVDWFVYTSALPKDHAELLLAKKLGIKATKRDEFIADLVEKLGLRMIAVTGTHGKTTTTAMLIWGCQQLGVEISYLVGSTLPFAPAGHYAPNSKYFVYEADEFDRNFLHFYPWRAVITSVSYDHADVYPTREEYLAAFKQFEKQSEKVIEDVAPKEGLTLAGEKRRLNASLAVEVLQEITDVAEAEIVEIMNQFPGVRRRFEKLQEGAVSDYAHHPEEIQATIDLAREEIKRDGKAGLVLVYEPHQNRRQHKIYKDYKQAFLGADKVFFLPTFLTRENPELKLLTTEELINEMENKEVAEAAVMGEELAEKLKDYQRKNYLVVLMTAGPADKWFRSLFGDAQGFVAER